MKEVYLDNAATTKVDFKVVSVMTPFLEEKYGNASSTHYKGEEARRAIEESREKIAKSIGGKYKEIVFTGSGTEANNFVLKGLFFANKEKGKNHIITTKIEHDCILNSCKWLETQGAKVTYLNVDSEGFVNLEELEKSINEKTLIVSVIHGNNEIGTIQDLESIGKICKKKGVLFHTDACQSYTKTKLDVSRFNLDFVTLNAHKIHGPKGVGALYVKGGKDFNSYGLKIHPLLHGGGHEFGLRSSTENVSGIVGFAKASELIGNSEIKQMVKLRDYMIEELSKINGAKLNGPLGEKRLCNNVNFSFEKIDGEMLGSYLNAKGIFTSAGSACSSHSNEASHVIKAIGKEKLASSTVRLSLSKYTTKEELDFSIENIKKTIDKLR